MKTYYLNTNTQVNDKPSTINSKEQVPQHEQIKLGIDWHADHFRVSRMIDSTPPQPAQRFSAAAFLDFVKEQLTLAKRVFSCYEAGPGGYFLHRQLTELGVTNYVVHPVNPDARRKGVATDKTDSRQLAFNLDRFLHGGDKALCPVYVPTSEEEQRRSLPRQREQLRKQRHRMASIGRSLLLTQGWREKTTWWKGRRWPALKDAVPRWLRQQLEVWRKLLQAVEAELLEVTHRVEATAAKVRPKGLGALTFAALTSEMCRWDRFKKLRQVGGYTGLCGGVSSSGPHHLDLSITKAGNARVRQLLIELAWRMAVYQPQYGPVKKYAPVLFGLRTHARRKKQLIVALARQLAVDLWRWQTGRTTAQQLQWVMIES